MNVVDLYEEFDMWTEYLVQKTTLDRPTAKDVCQVTFLELYDKYKEGPLPGPNTVGFLHTVLKRRAYNYIKQSTTNKHRERSYMSEYLARARVTRDMTEELTALFLLVPEYTDLLTKFYIDCWPYESLARKLKIGTSHVRSRLQRARVAIGREARKLVPLIALLTLVKENISEDEEVSEDGE